VRAWPADIPATWPARYGFTPPTLGSGLSGDSGDILEELIILGTALVAHLRKRINAQR